MVAVQQRQSVTRMFLVFIECLSWGAGLCLEGCSNKKNTNVMQTDKLGPKAAQSFVILPQGYRKTGIPDERMFGPLFPVGWCLEWDV